MPIDRAIVQLAGKPDALGIQAIGMYDPAPDSGPYLRLVGDSGMAVLYGLPPEHVKELAAWLGQSNLVSACFPDLEVQTFATPNDTLYAKQWAHGLPEDAGIHSEPVWDQITGSETIIAIVDTGVDASHEDLADNMWVNPNPTFGDLHGMSAHDGQISGNSDDLHSHGTHCAGIAAARGNNLKGVAGVCWSGKIMSTRFLDAKGRGYLSDPLFCWQYACEKGAKVLSNSWGLTGYGPLFDQVIRSYQAHINALVGLYDVIFVFAAGNANVNNDLFVSAPANVQNPQSVAVGCSDVSGGRSWFSQYGRRNVSVFAPGGSALAWPEYDDDDIWSTVPPALNSGAKYRAFAGTSMACPLVAGILALMIALHPTIPLHQWKAIMEGCCYADESLFMRARSHGRINLDLLARAAGNHAFTPSIEADFDPSDEARIIIKVKNNSAQNRTVRLCIKKECLPHWDDDLYDEQTYAPGETIEFPYELDIDLENPINYCMTAAVSLNGEQITPHAIGYWLGAVICPPGNAAVEVICDWEFDEPLNVDYQTLGLMNAGHHALLLRCAKSRAKLVEKLVNISGLYRMHQYFGEYGQVDVHTPALEDLEIETDLRDGAQALYTLHERILSLVETPHRLWSPRFQKNTNYVYLDLAYYMSTQKYRRLRASERFKSYTYHDFMYPESWQAILQECVLMLRKMRAIMTANVTWQTAATYRLVDGFSAGKDRHNRYPVEGLVATEIPCPQVDPSLYEEGEFTPPVQDDIVQQEGYESATVYYVLYNPPKYPYMDGPGGDIIHGSYPNATLRSQPGLVDHLLLHLPKQFLYRGIYYIGVHCVFNHDATISGLLAPVRDYFPGIYVPTYIEIERPDNDLVWENSKQVPAVAGYRNGKPPFYEDAMEPRVMYAGDYDRRFLLEPFALAPRERAQTQWWFSAGGAVRATGLTITQTVLPVTVFLDLKWQKADVETWLNMLVPRDVVTQDIYPEENYGMLSYHVERKLPGESEFTTIYSGALDISGFVKTVKPLQDGGLHRIKLDELDLYSDYAKAEYRVMVHRKDLPLWSLIMVHAPDGDYFAGPWNEAYIVATFSPKWIFDPQNHSPINLGNNGYYVLYREAHILFELRFVPDFDAPLEQPTALRVPNLIGRIWDPVEQQLTPPAPAHVNVRVETHRHPQYRDVPYVFAQTPPPSSILRRDDDQIEVSCFVMEAPEEGDGGPIMPDRANVPNVLGLDLASAEAALRAAGLEPECVFVQTNLCPKGHVHHQLPAPGDFWAKGAYPRVVLTICSNHLEGFWQDRHDEEREVENQVFAPLVDPAQPQLSACPRGLVDLKATPRNILYSSEPIAEPVRARVPCLLGLSLEDAEALAAELGLEVVDCGERYSTRHKGEVCEQLPRWGHRVMANNKILVAVSRGRPVLDDLFRCARFPVED